MKNKKLCLITGSTSGIGKETALGLARKGFQIIIHGRNEERGRKVLDKISQVSETDGHDLILADFSSLEEVRSMADKIEKNYDQLDVLINNAGIWVSEPTLSEDGIELTFAVNHLAHFLLTNLLSKLLIDSSPSQIINVSSAAHEGSSIDFERIQGKDVISGYSAYKQSKLANILFTYELADRLEGSGVTANCLHPGTVKTRLAREYGILGKIWKHFPLFKTPKEAAETSIFLATSSKVSDVTGEYFKNKKIENPSQEAQNPELRKELWNRSVELVELKSEESEIIQ